MRLPPINPYITVIISIFSAATAAIFIKLLADVPVTIIAFYRSLIAVILIAPFVLYNFKSERKRLISSDWLWMIISACLLVAHLILWYTALQYTSVASSMILLALLPIVIFIGSYFFYGQRFSVATLISIFIALCGTVIISWEDHATNQLLLLGNLLTIAAVLFIAAYLLVGQTVRRKLSLLTYMFIIYSFIAIGLFIYNVIVGNAFFAYGKIDWLYFIGLALIPTIISQITINWSLKWMRNSTIAIATVFEPVIAAFLAYYLLNESITGGQWLGGTIIIFGLFLFIMGTTAKKKVTISQSPRKQ